jgi:diguanylate cyclase (GGDEF)-like protein
VTVRATAGSLPGVARLQPDDDLSDDIRIAATLDRQATVARLDSQGGDPAGLVLGPGAVAATPVWAAGRIVGVLAFMTGDARSEPFTPWQFGVLELLSDGIARLLEPAPYIDLRSPAESTTAEPSDPQPGREGDERYRTVVETLAEGILIHDPTGRVYGCNPSATAILGAAEADLLRTDGRVSGTQWVLPNGSPLGSQSFPALVTLRTGRPIVDQVLGLVRSGAATHWLRVNARPLSVAGDPRFHAVTSFADITAERRAERALAAQVEFEALAASISTRLIDCPPELVDDTITGALGEVARLFDADVGFISELSSDRTTLRLSHEWRRPGVPPHQRTSDAAPMSAFAWVARQFESVPYVLVRSLEDLPVDAQGERDAYTAGGNRAFLWVRLGGGLDLAGIAGIAWKDRVPSAAEEQILSLVRLVGEAFLGALRRRSVGLLAQGRAQVFELIARGAPLPETLEAVARLLEVRSEGTTAAVFLLAGNGRTLTLAAAPGLEPARQRMLDGVVVASASPAGQAVRDAEAVVVSDVARDPRFPEARSAAERLHARSITASPIVSSRTAKVLGVLLLQGAEPHATDQVDGAWLESCAVLAAVAIERAEDEARLGFQATHDPLTGVSNRSALLDRLELALARNKRSSRRLAVFFCDLDRFKGVNDLHGHNQGDALLVEVARRIQAVLRPSDTVARFGGDEFVVLAEDVEDAEQALHLADRVANAVESRPISIGGTELMITASIGIALSTDNLDNPEALLRDADMAMYRAKANGRARRELFQERHREESETGAALVEELGRALETGELRLHYQPIVSLDGPLRGVEALLRWRHPRRGIIHPVDFLSAAEESGLIVQLGAWVFGEASRQLSRWGGLDPRLRSLSMHVNVSSRQLAEPGMAEAFRAATESAGVSPSSFVIEIAEGVLVADTPGTARVLAELARLGCRVALDDFGTAYASLTFLRRFPVHALKIDQSFVEGVGREREDTAIVEAVINLAHALDLEAIAEGVETDHQVSALRELGCDSVQGYVIAPPAPADEATDQLLRRLDTSGGRDR